MEAPVPALRDVALDDERFVGSEVEEAECVLGDLETGSRQILASTEHVVLLFGARVEHVLVPERDRPAKLGGRLVEPGGELVGREGISGRVVVETFNREGGRLARLPVEVVLTDRDGERALRQRHPVGLVALAAEQDLEVVVGADADVVRGELGDGARSPPCA